MRTADPPPEEATGAIVRGLTRQVGNEIDEFVTEAVRNNLLGLPLDLPALNIARGRDTGLPSLNGARAQFYADTGDSQLTPYISWVDFAQHLKHPESLVNFLAAYGTHSTITIATTLADKRVAAMAIVFGDQTIDPDGIPGNGDETVVVAPADRFDFLNSTGDWANDAGTHAKDVDGATTTGLGSVDLWIGGLAEEIMPFGGMLGSTFNFRVRDAAREPAERRPVLLPVSHRGDELPDRAREQLVLQIGDAQHRRDASPGRHLLDPSFIFEVDPTKQFTGLNEPGPDGIQGTPDDEVGRTA